LAGSSGNC